MRKSLAAEAGNLNSESSSDDFIAPDAMAVALAEDAAEDAAGGHVTASTRPDRGFEKVVQIGDSRSDIYVCMITT